MAGRPRTMYRSLYGLFKRQLQIWRELSDLRPEQYKNADPMEEPEGEIHKAWRSALYAQRGPTNALGLVVGLMGQKLSPADAQAIRAEFGDTPDEEPEGDNLCPDCLAVVPVAGGEDDDDEFLPDD